MRFLIGVVLLFCASASALAEKVPVSIYGGLNVLDSVCGESLPDFANVQNNLPPQYRAAQQKDTWGSTVEEISVTLAQDPKFGPICTVIFHTNSTPDEVNTAYSIRFEQFFTKNEDGSVAIQYMQGWNVIGRVRVEPPRVINNKQYYIFRMVRN